MKRVFLTSGLILCMAAQANAVQTTDIGTGASNANCVETTLGVDNGSTSFEAKWEAKDYRVVYMCGTGATPTTALSITGTPTDPVFDSSYTFAASPASSCTKTGYSVNQWDCGSTVGSHAFGSTATWSWDLSGTPGSVTCNATWFPNISGNITLDSKVYKSDNTNQSASTAASPTPIFSAYNYAMYKTKPTTSNYTAATNKITSVSTPSATGYTFGGFYTSKINAGASTSGKTKVINADGTFVTANATTQVTETDGTKIWYAYWTPKTYTVTYNPGTCNGTAVTSSSAIVTYDANFTPQAWGSSTPVNISGLTAPAHYHFDAWRQGSQSGTRRPAGTAFKYTGTDGPLTLYAQCVGDGTNLSFGCGTDDNPNSNITGGATVNNNVISDMSAIYGDSFTWPESTCAGKYGYTSAGTWNCDATGYTAKTAGSTDNPWAYEGADGGTLSCVINWNPNISGNITLNSSIWTDSSTEVTTGITGALDKSGGDNIVFSAYDYSIYTLQPTTSNYTASTNKITSINRVPSKSGYNFKGFYNQKQILHSTSNSGTLMIDTGKAIQPDAKTQIATTGGTTTWYARWMPVISGNITLDSKIYTSAEDTTGITVTNSNPTTVWSAYDYSMYQNVKPTEDNYVTASTTCTSGTTCKITSITAPSKTGYTFGGFYTSKNVVNGTASGTKVINADGTFTNVAKKQRTNTDNATWYAYWTANTTTVTYNCGNPVSGSASTASFKSGSGATVFDNPSNHSNTATYDASYTHPVGANTCQMAGYTFASWHCVQGTIPSISGSTITNNGITSGKWSADMANVTCTAKWTQNEINLNYNANCASGTTCASWSNDAATQCTYDTTFNLPTQPLKKGYTFRGWTVASGNN